MNILDTILESTQKRLATKKASLPLADLKNVLDSIPMGDFRFEKALRKSNFALICEIKKASPSKGIIATDFRPVEIALAYQNSGANAISCLTEPEFFLGDDTYINAIKQQVFLPILRKDFIIDEYMIYEAKLLGADAVLLIARILSTQQLKDYLEITNALGISALVEAHTPNDVQKALSCGAHIIGINNRDLQSFAVSIQTSIELKQMIPNDVICISESGITSREDILLLQANGINGALIGESLMRSDDKQALLYSLKGLQ